MKFTVDAPKQCDKTETKNDNVKKGLTILAPPIAFVLTSILVTTSAALSTEAPNLLLSEKFKSFKTQHNRVYDGEEHAKRFAIFEENVDEVARKNMIDNVHGITRVRCGVGYSGGVQLVFFSLT